MEGRGGVEHANVVEASITLSLTDPTRRLSLVSPVPDSLELPHVYRYKHPLPVSLHLSLIRARAIEPFKVSVSLWVPVQKLDLSSLFSSTLRFLFIFHRRTRRFSLEIAPAIPTGIKKKLSIFYQASSCHILFTCSVHN